MTTLLAWLLTYLVHSTVLLGGALLLRIALRERRLGLQEGVLRAALLGAFVTATLQVGFGVRPLGGALRIDAVSRAPEAATRPAATAPRAERPRDGGGASLHAWTPAAVAPDPPSLAGRIRGLAPPTGWRPLLFAAWAFLAALAFVRLCVGAARLRLLLAGRQRVESGELPGHVAELAAATGLRRPVRLSTTPDLAVPLATGLLRPEVCLPEQALEAVDEDGVFALCAHEVAHLARRDPAWIVLARLAVCLVPFQPLNLWAARRLRDLAECLADDLAVAASARPHGLARSLVDVAAWTVAGPFRTPATAAAAIGGRSRLRHRVERLMDPVRRLERPGRTVLPLAAFAVLATALVTPVVSGGDPQDDARPSPAAKAAPSAAPAPAASARPAPRAPRAAPRAERERETSAERRLEALSRRIEERASLNREEMRRLEAEIEAIVARVRPSQAEMERLHAEAERAARLSEADRRAIAEKARALAELARPTAEEARELSRLAEEVAREAMPDAEEIARITREAMESARPAMEHAMRDMGPELERAMEQLHRAAEDLRRAAEEHRRAADEVRKLREKR